MIDANMKAEVATNCSSLRSVPPAAGGTAQLGLECTSATISRRSIFGDRPVRMYFIAASPPEPRSGLRAGSLV